VSATGTTKPPAVKHEVDLPAGGRLELKNADEVTLWNESAKRYQEDYGIHKANDLMLLGAILSQAIAMYRAQRDLNDTKKASGAQGIIIKASTEIRELEKALGIDKKTREAGGQHTVANYVASLKRAGHEFGVRIANRTKAYEKFVMELRWKVRLLDNGDAEDRREHNISERTVLEWVRVELGTLEEADKKWANEKGKVFVGKM
jgi:hypothetical protein